MRSRSYHRLKYLTAPIALLGTAGALVILITGGTLGGTTACGCGSADVPQEFLNAKTEIVKSKKFTSTMGSTTVEQAAEWRVVCKKGVTKGGEISGTAKIAKTEIFLEECEGTKLAEPEKGKTCNAKSKGASEPKDIKIEKLEGELGEVAAAEAASEVGLLMKSEAGKAWVEIEGTCIPHSPVRLEGELAAEVKQSLGVTGTFVFTPAGGEKGQKIKGIETSANVAVNPKFTGFAAAIVEVSSTLTNAFEEKVEATKGT